MKRKILCVIGTRPEAIKMMPVVQCLRQTAGVKTIVCTTAQHRQMLDQVLSLFDITPAVDLNLMKPNQTLAEVTAAIFTHLDPVFRDLRPDRVLAQGDTTTVMVTAILAYYNRVHFGHVEAGLRTGDKFQPFPEEVNRMVAGVIADLHFAPTDWAKQNLIRENIPENQIVVTGNPIIDALQQVAQKTSPLEVDTIIKRNADKHIILVTAHRRENFGRPLENICAALQRIAEENTNSVQIVYPVHPNPNVREIVYQRLRGITNITLLPPLDYLPMVHLMKNAYLILTDSGGIQEEAPTFGVPVLVLRNVTERPEGIRAGVSKLVGTEVESITSQTRLLLQDKNAYQKMARSANPYGDGRAAQRIVDAILNAY